MAAKQKFNAEEQFFKVCLPIFRASKATKSNPDTGEIIEVELNSDHKIIYSYFVHTEQFCKKNNKDFDYSIEHMSNFCGIERQKFMRRKKDLEKLGLIEVQRRGNGRKNMYKVNSSDVVEFYFPDGKIAPSRTRDYEKQSRKNVRVSNPSEINTPKQGESDRRTKEEDTYKQSQTAGNTGTEAKVVDLTGFLSASQKSEESNAIIKIAEDSGNFLFQERSSSNVPEDWLLWHETISLYAMTLDSTPITDEGNITLAGLKILKKCGLDPVTQEANWFCWELREAFTLNRNTFT